MSPITPEQRLARRTAIGSSDVPAILNLTPPGALGVYLQKVHNVEPPKETRPMRLGNRFEYAIIEEAAERLGVQVEHNVTVQGPEPWLRANLDAIVIGDDRRHLEAKFSGMGTEFGEPGTDAVPERVLVQTAHQMLCRPSREVIVPVLLPRYGRARIELYSAPRNEGLIEVVFLLCRKFWEEHVLAGIPPEPFEGYGGAALDVLKRVRRQPQKTVQVEPALALAYREAAAAETAAKKAKAEAQAALLAAAGDAEALDFGDGKTIFTYFEYDRAGYTVAPGKHRSLKLVNR
jgi:predicted phage-related endonuclease